MRPQRLTLYVSTRAEFRRIVQEQLKERCLLVPTDEELAWDSTVEVRMLVRGRALDLVGRVVNPDLRVGDSRLVGLLIDLTRAEWAALGFLERAFLEGDDEPTSDIEVPGAAIRRNRRGEATGSVPAIDADLVDDTIDDTPVPEAPSSEPASPPSDESGSASDLDSTLDGPPFEGADDVAFEGDAEDDDDAPSPDAFDERPGTSRHVIPANASGGDVSAGDVGGATFDQSALEAARQDAVRRTIETVKPLANPRLASSSQAVEYRADQPDKARRADELATQASTALADGDLQQARVLARLAVVYNPHEPEFRALSELVEHRIVQIDPGAAS